MSLPYQHVPAAEAKLSAFPVLVSARNNQESSRGISSRAQFRMSRRVQWTLRANRTVRARDDMPREGSDGIGTPYENIPVK